MTAAILRMRACEALLVDSLHEVILLVEHVGVNIIIFGGSFLLLGFGGLLFFDLFFLIHDIK